MENFPQRRYEPKWLWLYRRDKAWGDPSPLWKYLPGVNTWDDPVWEWALEIPLPFKLKIRIGRGRW